MKTSIALIFLFFAVVCGNEIGLQIKENRQADQDINSQLIDVKGNLEKIKGNNNELVTKFNSVLTGVTALIESITGNPKKVIETENLEKEINGYSQTSSENSNLLQ